MFPAILYFFLLIELVIVSYIDLKYRRIVNMWGLLNLVLFGVCLVVYPKLFSFSFSTLFYPLAFLGVGFVLFVLKIMGGGDSKFLFSYFLLVPEQFHELFFLKLIYSTIVIGSFLLVYNSAQNFDKISWELKRKNFKGLKKYYGSKFAYAPVILFSWLCFGWDIYNQLVY